MEKRRPYERRQRVIRQAPRQRVRVWDTLQTGGLLAMLLLVVCWGGWQAGKGLHWTGAGAHRPLPPVTVSVPQLAAWGRIISPLPAATVTATHTTLDKEKSTMATYTGSNAGTSGANGEYALLGQHNGKDYWGNGSHFLYWDGFGAYNVASVLDAATPAYYYPSVENTPPLNTEFYVVEGAAPGIIFNAGGGTGSVSCTLTLIATRKLKQGPPICTINSEVTVEGEGVFALESQAITWDTGDTPEVIFPPILGEHTHDYTTPGWKYVQMTLGGTFNGESIIVESNVLPVPLQSGRRPPESYLI